MPLPLLPIAAGIGAGAAATKLPELFKKSDANVFATSDPVYKDLLSKLGQKVKASGGNVTDTTLFKSGVGNLQQVLDILKQSDTARSAAAGTLGTETDIAQSASRSSALSQGIRDILATATQNQQVQENQDFRNLFGVLQAIDQNAKFEQALKEQRRAEMMNFLSSGVGSIVSALAGAPGAGGGGGGGGFPTV